MTAWRLSERGLTVMSNFRVSCPQQGDPQPTRQILMKRTKPVLLAIFILILASLACNALLPQAKPTSIPALTIVPSQITETVSAPPPATSENLPQTDAEVPRVPPDQAK